jgi:hypothetical protein
MRCVLTVFENKDDIEVRTVDSNIEKIAAAVLSAALVQGCDMRRILNLVQTGKYSEPRETLPPYVVAG